MPSITYSIGGSATAATLSGTLPAGISGVFNAGVFTISGTPTESGSFAFTVTTTGPCVNTSASGSILVNANGTISLTSPGVDNQTVCISNSITPVTYLIGGGATGASIVAGSLPAGVTGTFSSGVFTISGTPTVSGTFNYTVRANGPCIQPTLSGVLVVDANSTINLSSGAGTHNRTVCINTAMPSIIWTVGGGATGATVTGLPAGVSATYNSANKQFTISGTPTVNGSFPYTVTTTGPCVNTSATGTITVNQDATIVLTSAAGSNLQAVCVSQQAITPITYLIGGGGTGATVSGLPAGVTGSYNAGTKIFTISGTPTASGTFSYSVTTTGPCLKPALGGTITVNARPVANAITGVNNLCIGATVTLTPNASGAAPLSFTWSSSSPAVATVNNSGVLTGLVAGTSNITYTVTNGNGCTQTSAAFPVTVKAIATGSLSAVESSGFSANDNIICAGANVTFTATPGYVVYHFKVNGSTVQNGIANVYNTTSLSNGDVVTVDVTNSTACIVTFNAITITVHDLPAGSLTANENSGTANDNQICAGELVTFTATPGYSNYVFKVNGAGVQSGPSNIFTTTTLSGVSAVTVEVTNNNNCKTVWGPQTITVNGLPGGTITATENSGSTPNNNEVCAGDAVTFVATSGFSNYNFIVNGVSVQSGASNTFISTSLTNPSIVTVEVANAGGCQAALGPVIISVNDLPAGVLTGTENSGVANDMEICEGENVTFTATAGYNNYTFKVNGTTVQSGGNNTYNSTSLVNGDAVTVEVTGDGGCSAIFNAVSVIVNGLPSATLTATENSGVPNNNTICTGDNITFAAAAGYSNYQFMVNGTVVQNGVSDTYSDISLQDGDEVSVSVTAASGCVATSSEIVVTVVDLPSGSLSFSENSGTSPDDGVICTGATVTFTATAGYSSYNFYVNGVVMQSGVLNDYVTSSLADGASVVAEATNAAGCSQVFNSIVVTVNPLPAGTLTFTENSGSANDGTICPGSTIVFNATSGFSNYNFKVNGVSAQSSSSSTFSTSSINLTSSIEVEVTNSNGCVNILNSVTITVSALPSGVLTAAENSGSAANDDSICTGGTVLFTATPGYSSYQFMVNGSVAQSGASNLFSTNTLLDGDVVSVEVYHANGCSLVYSGVTINVFDYPVVAPISGVTGVCKGSTLALSNTTPGGTWASSNTSVAAVHPSTGVVTGVAAGSTDISYTVVNGSGCSATVTATVEVFELPVPTLTGPNPFCPETISQYTTEAGQSNYVWTVTGGTILSGGTSTDNSIMVDWNLPGVKSIFVNYTNANGCAGATSTTVTGSTGIIPIISGANQVCNNTNGLLYTTQSGYSDYEWNVTGGTITSGGGLTDNFVVVDWNVAGTGTVSVNFSNMFGCTAAAPSVRNVLVRALPTATVSGSAQVCQDAASPFITFTGAAGVAPYTFNYQINGGAIQSVTTVSGNSVTVSVPTTAVGSFEYSLVNVTGANGCAQTQSGSATIIVNSLPTATISGTNSVCRGGSSAITFTGSNGTSPYT
ncbi:MAG: hypothetical protein EOP49_05945, partial [Sphingobacteriales bacterium]